MPRPCLKLPLRLSLIVLGIATACNAAVSAPACLASEALESAETEAMRMELLQVGDAALGARVVHDAATIRLGPALSYPQAVIAKAVDDTVDVLAPDAVALLAKANATKATADVQFERIQGELEGLRALRRQLEEELVKVQQRETDLVAQAKAVMQHAVPNPFGDTLQRAAGAAAEAAGQSAAQAVTRAVDRATEAFSHDVTGLASAVAQEVTAIHQASLQSWAVFTAQLNTSVDNTLYGARDMMLDQVGNIVNALRPLLQGSESGRRAQSMMDASLDKLKDLEEDLNAFLHSKALESKELAASEMDALKSSLQRGVDSVNGFLASFVQAFQDFAAAAVGQLHTLLSNGPDSVVNALEGSIHKLQNEVVTGEERLSKAIGELPAAIDDGLQRQVNSGAHARAGWPAIRFALLSSVTIAVLH